MSAPASSAIEEAVLPRVMRDTGAALLGSIGEGLLRYGLFFVLAAGLGAESFGVYLLGLSLVTFWSVATRLGLDEGLVYAIPAELAQHRPARANDLVVAALALALVIGVAAAAVLVLVGPAVAARLFQAPGLERVMPLFAAAVPLWSLLIVLLGAWRGFLMIRQRALVQGFIYPGLSLLLALAALVVTRSLPAVVFAYSASIAVAFGIGLGILQAHRGMVGWRLAPLATIAPVIRYSMPLMATELLLIVVLWAEVWLLGAFRGSQEVGIYGVTVRLAMVGTIIQVSLNNVLAPVIADHHHRRDHRAVGELFQLATRWNLTIALPIFLLCIVFSRETLALFGEAFQKGATVLVVVTLAQLCDVAAGPVGNVVTMAGRSGWRLANLFVSMVLTVAVGWWLIPRGGMMGAAITNVVSSLCINVIGLLQVRRLIGVWPYQPGLMKLAWAAGVMTAAAVGLRWLWPPQGGLMPLSLQAAACVLLYVAMLVAFGMDGLDRRLLQRVWERAAEATS